MAIADIERDNLLERLKAGDEDALKEIFDIYYEPLCIYSVQFTEKEYESKDIVQDIFIRIWEKKLYSNITHLNMYLFLSVRNESIKHAQRNGYYKSIEELEELAYDTWDSEFSEEEINEKRQRLNDTLLKLSPKEHQVLTEIIINDKRYKQVAEEMHISVNTVKTHLKRAMKILRNDGTLCLIPFM